MTSSSILYTLYFAIVAWLYSSIDVLFLSDSVPELYNMFLTKCMWFTLMSGILLMCSRTPSWKALQDCRLLNGLAKLLQRWRDDALHLLIVSHQERFVFLLRLEKKIWTKPSSARFCTSVFRTSPIGGLTFSKKFHGLDFKKPKGLYDTSNPVIRHLYLKKEVFCSNLKKTPLWSRLSPAANDVKPVYTVFVNLSLLSFFKKKIIMFKYSSDVLGVWTHANSEVRS